MLRFFSESWSVVRSAHKTLSVNSDLTDELASPQLW